MKQDLDAWHFNADCPAPRLAEENERLRAALQEIVTAFDKWPPNAVPLGRGAEAFAEIAKAALSGRDSKG